MIEKNNWKGRIVEEDILLNQDVLSLIESLHGKVEKIEKHYKVGGKEVDAIIYCKKKKMKTIGVELKEFDLIKAVEQAIERRKYFNYFYVIISSDKRYLGYDFRNLYFDNRKILDKFFTNYIGLIVVRNDGSFLVCPSFNIPKHLSQGIERWLK